jgi:hypothetical protein
MKQSHRAPVGRAVLAIAIAGALAACSNDDDPPPPDFGALQIKTLSNRADLVSGGDALVEVVLPAGAPLDGLAVDVDGRDVTSAFARREDGRVTGVVTGLKNGDNVITARTASTRAAKLTVTNAPRGGPVLAGVQPLPFVCATPTPQPATGTTPATNASGLSTTAVDAQCNIATETKLWYKTTAAGCSATLPDPSPSVPYTATAAPPAATQPANPCFKPYTAGTTPPDLATTTTDNGVTVPYVVRVERGTMNRGIYDIAVLFDTTKPWTAVSPQPQWNGKVYYQFGASTGQPRRQLRPAPSWTDDRALSRGYMVVQNSMTDSLQNSNRVMMAETVMMMKEHIVDSYGPIAFTMGTGCSGGSINSHMTMSVMPNLMDGFVVSCAYPDSETTGIEVADCTLLVEAYQKPEWLAAMTAGGYTQAEINRKKAAINGHEDQTACHGWYNLFGSNAQAGNYFPRTVPAANMATGAIVQATTAVNNCQLPASQVYDPATNPTGARCNASSWAESIWGRVPGSSQALDTRDNVGVQYGLKALRAGAITPEEFVVLNEIVGGTDRDTALRTARSAADPQALEIAYRAGIVMSGLNHAKHAEIDLRGYDDSLTPPVTLPQGVFLTGIHHVWRSFSIRDRIDRDAGDHGNHVMWRFGLTGFAVPPAPLAAEAFTTMDRWLAAIKADTSSTPIERKVRAAKPAGLADFCILSSDPAQSTRVTNMATCDADPLLNPEASPRQVAGGPRTEDVLKCQLKPIDVADYAPATLSGSQLARLVAVFPQGVCDWSRQGVGQQPPAGPLSFKAGPGGKPLPDAPVSTDAR